MQISSANKRSLMELYDIKLQLKPTEKIELGWREIYLCFHTSASGKVKTLQTTSKKRGCNDIIQAVFNISLSESILWRNNLCRDTRRVLVTSIEYFIINSISRRPIGTSLERVIIAILKGRSVVSGKF